ncbi:MAG: hypothetical protein CM1200mP30_13740 [Pseudomonadota bacterium]|nr:MAG: hypothetical protein CM1200mP30_13740 [Pseudomonadota bacterium]
MEPLIQEKTFRHKLIIQSTAVYALSRLGEMRQVLINLLGNAIKFSDHEGRIGINCWKDEKSISIAIEDSGCGIAEHEQQQIFEVFHQAESSSDNSKRHRSRSGSCEKPCGTSGRFSFDKKQIWTGRHSHCILTTK